MAEDGAERVKKGAYELKLSYVGAAAVAGLGLFLLSRYKVSSPDQYIVRTGLGIKDMAISKKCFVLPFQRAVKVALNPKTYEFSLHNMSKEKVEFNLPVVFTIGPISPVTHPEGFMQYAQNLNSLQPGEIETLIKGVIEGETRGLTATMTVEELFNSKELFKAEVVTKIEDDLNKLGLTVLNANIKEMSDYDEHNQYFTYRKQRAVETANYESQVEVARERTRGTIGMKEQEREMRATVSTLETEATIIENERNAELASSNATLEEAKAVSKRRGEIANVEATMATHLRKSELQTNVEKQRQTQLLEQLRADKLTGTRVAAEQSIAEAEGRAESMRRIADAELYEQIKRAEGTQSLLLAHSAGLGSIINACGGDGATARFYLALKDDLFVKLAQEQARAVSGMQPKISVWNTGSGQDPANSSAPILKLVQSFAPMLDGIHQHTDFRAPTWLVNHTESK